MTQMAHTRTGKTVTTGNLSVDSYIETDTIHSSSPLTRQGTFRDELVISLPELVQLDKLKTASHALIKELYPIGDHEARTFKERLQAATSRETIRNREKYTESIKTLNEILAELTQKKTATLNRRITPQHKKL